MGKRLTRIYTRTGDDGSTGLANGSRVAKNDLRIEAMGAVDELNSVIGLLLAERLPARVRAVTEGVQHDLFDLGGELSLPGHTLLSAAHVARVEQWLDTFNATLPPLRDFILPGGTRAAALAHLARTVCRRAERRVVALSVRQTVATVLPQYLNRLSDLLFVVARVANRAGRRRDVLWVQGKNRGER